MPITHTRKVSDGVSGSSWADVTARTSAYGECSVDRMASSFIAWMSPTWRSGCSLTSGSSRSLSICSSVSAGKFWSCACNLRMCSMMSLH